MSRDTRVVQTDESKRAHVVRLGVHFDGEGKALCGVRPFPERWYMVTGSQVERKPVCPACLQEARRK